MTKRDNLLRTLKREGFAAVPLDMELCPSQVENFKRLFGHDDFRTWFGLPFRSIWLQIDPAYPDGRGLFKRESLPAETRFDAWGVAHSKGSDAAMHMRRMHHPLKGDLSLDELKEYPFPVINEAAIAGLPERTAEIRDSGLAAVASMACTIWETAWYLRGMDDLMVDMLTDDPKAEILLDSITTVSMRRAALYASAGADILQLGDDIGMQNSILMSTGLWREWIKPRLVKVIRAARSLKPDILIHYHSCGYVVPFLEDLIEIGVDILNPVQPESMPFSEVHAMTSGRLSYWGTIGTQTTLPFGTPADVRSAVAENVGICGPNGGIVIGPTHLVEPEVPWANLVALKEAVEACS